MTRIFLSAGETSGDIHGANLVRALTELDPSVTCEGLGGRSMESAGMTLHYDMAGRHVMGFSEVLKSLKLYRRLLLDAGRRILSEPPDCLVLIDNPDFNLRLAKFARRAGVPVVYYISPQIWAWRKGRIKTIGKRADKMLVILPFEEKLYRDAGINCTFVGHPLLDHVPETAPEQAVQARPWTIALLPGSREQEIARLMPVMLQLASDIRTRYPDTRFVTPCVNEERRAQIAVHAEAGNFPLETLVGKSHEVLRQARFALVASGTATLETALFGVPMVILYRTASVSYWIARLLVQIPYIGLVNILAGRGVVPEFIQSDATAERILPHAFELTENTERRSKMLKDLADLKTSMGKPGASQRAASEILNVMKERMHG